MAVERFEGVLEKMDKCCRQDNARSEVFPDEEHNPWYRNAGGVGGDVGKRDGCPIRTLTVPSMEGNSEGMVRRTKEGYDEYHCRRPSSLERLRLSRSGTERRVHSGGWGQGGTRYWMSERQYWEFATVIGRDQSCTFPVTRHKRPSGVGALG